MKLSILFFSCLNNYIKLAADELFKLVDITDFSYMAKNSIYVLPRDWKYTEYSAYEYFLAEVHFVDFIVTSLNPFLKYFLLFHIFITWLFFFHLTSTTFWLLPPITLLLGGILSLFFSRLKISVVEFWWFGQILFTLCGIYQLLLICLYAAFFSNGFILKVGLAGAFTFATNFNFCKLLIILIIFFLLFVTVIFYLQSYTATLATIKFELCSVLLFLGFGSTMIFLQNDLFSIFLYFELISFCLYALLLLHNWTSAQLYSLVRYVLLSLWVSTCYLLGVAFYLAAANLTTNLLDLSVISLEFHHEVYNMNNYTKLFSSSNLKILLLHNFEFICSITFLLIYFLFKLGAGPFYSWVIEVYNSCATAALAAVSIIPKLIYFPILFFLLYFNFIEYQLYWTAFLLTIGTITTTIGCFGILLTDRLKEIYAWSSITHSGNLLILLSCLTVNTFTLLFFYLIAYAFISLGFIIFLMCLKNTFVGRLVKTISELCGISTTHPVFYFSSIVLFASAAGFTPFLSFFMKFSLLTITIIVYGAPITLFIGIINIVGSIGYLRILRTLIGFNYYNWFALRGTADELTATWVYTPYAISVLLNLICTLVFFSLFFYSEFLTIFNNLADPILGDKDSLITRT